MANQISIVKQPLYGKVVWDGIEFIYTPDEGFSGTDYYIYVTTDGVTSQTITRYVNTNNLPPTAASINLTVNAADVVPINVTNYISDPNTPLEYVKIISITKPLYGIASFNDTIITYQSNGINCKELFSYTISDGQYESTGQIQLNVINGANPQIPDYILNALSSLESDMNLIAINSGGWQSSYTLLASKSAEWSTIDAIRFNNVSNIVETNSASWNEVGSRNSDIVSSYNIVYTNSAGWDETLNSINSITTTYNTDSGNWTTAYNIVCGASADWNKNITDLNDLTNYFYYNSSNWDSTYNTVSVNSASWDKAPLTNYLNSNSGNWDSSYNTVCANSAIWDETYTGLTGLSTLFYDNSSNWDSTYNTVSTNSGSWDKAPLTNYLTTNSGNWDSIYNIVSVNSGSWDNLVASFSSLSSNYSQVSGNWDSTYNTVFSQSALWDSTLLASYLSTNSGNWDSTYNTISANSANWGAVDSLNILSADYSINSGYWQNAYNLVDSNSSDWDNTSVKATIQTNSADWSFSYTFLTQNSGKWNSSYNTITGVSSVYSASSGNWQTTYNLVCSQSSGWGDKSAYSVVTGNSANWSSAYTTLTANSSTWNTVSSYYVKYDTGYNILTTNSANWDASYNKVGSGSAIWDDTYSVVNANSAKWLSGGTSVDLTVNDLIISGNAVFYGNLTAEGTTTQLNTEVVATSAFAITNTGFVDAMRVTKTQTTGAIASFESNGNPVLYVSPLNRVGINTNNPNQALTVVGNISASGIIYGSVPSEYTTFINNSSKYENSYTYVFNNSGAITDFKNNKPIYDSSSSLIISTSAGIKNYDDNRSSYLNALSIVGSQSAANNASYTFLTGNSGNIGVDTIYRANSAKYENAANYIANVVASNAQINFIFDGGGGVIESGATGMVQIPYKVNIVSWAILSDVATNAAVQVLSSDYNSYPNYVNISGITNAPVVISNTKASNTSTLTDWVTSISSDSILKFNLLSNSAATSLTLSIKCTKG